MARVTFTFDDKRLRQNLDELPDKVKHHVSIIIDFNAAFATIWMKDNAPWTDDTGAARSGLIAIANHFASSEEILMSYSVHYGIWLEIANNRRYEILQSAMRVIGHKVMQDLEALLDR